MEIHEEKQVCEDLQGSMGMHEICGDLYGNQSFMCTIQPKLNQPISPPPNQHCTQRLHPNGADIRWKYLNQIKKILISWIHMGLHRVYNEFT